MTRVTTTREAITLLMEEATQRYLGGKYEFREKSLSSQLFEPINGKHYHIAYKPLFLEDEHGDSVGCEKRINLILSLLENVGINYKGGLQHWSPTTKTEHAFVFAVFNRALGLNRNYRGEDGAESKFSTAEKGCYTFIPSERRRFLSVVGSILKKNPSITSLMDIGAGTGDKPLLAYICLPQLTKVGGIEITPHTFELSKHLAVQVLGLRSPQKHYSSIPHCFTFRGKPNSIEYLFNGIPAVSFYRKDAFKFSDFNSWDLVFTYNPIADCSLLRKLYTHIFANMKVGGYFYEIGDTYPVKQVLDGIDFRVVDHRERRHIRKDTYIRKRDENTFELFYVYDEGVY